jgi:putative restriction endonuclease
VKSSADVPAIVLESHVTSVYADTLGSYEFPRRYLKFLEAASFESPILAVIYEPRGDDNSGRMAYVGWAWVTQRPSPTGRQTKNGEDLFIVVYDGGVNWFPRDARREMNGEPLEGWLRLKPRGRSRNVATFGRAVRPIATGDVTRIFGAAGQEIGALETADREIDYPERVEHESPPVLAAERARRIVEVLERDAQFRRDVLAAYQNHCAISGFEIGTVATYQARRILDAAHIRPVARQGPDHVTNGLALTPTLHRLFDEGLFALAYSAHGLVTRVSPRLERCMIESPDGRFRLPLEDGLRVTLPAAMTLRPDPAQIAYHAREVFLAS